MDHHQKKSHKLVMFPVFLHMWPANRIKTIRMFRTRKYILTQVTKGPDKNSSIAVGDAAISNKL